jgi:spermidine/putrescine transport system substrate-binding protein
MTEPRMSLTRRRLLERAAAGGAVLLVPGWLAACGGGIGGDGNGNGEAGPGDRTLRDTLRISNWPLYIDIDEDTRQRPTIQGFMEEYGIAVRYVEDVNDNNEYFARIQPSLSQGQGVDRDLVVLTDWMAARLIRNEWVQPLDEEALENKGNLVEALRSPSFDPERRYSMPWQSGMTGIGYNPELTGGEVTSIEQLLTDENLRGRVALLSEMPDTVGLVMLSNGDDPTNVEAGAFENAIETIRDAVDRGQIRQFTGNEYSGLLARGDLAACVAWSGDITQLQLDNPNLRFAVPDDGAMIWTDNMLIPLGGHAYTASVFMDYVYRPEVAAQIAEYVNFISPVEGAQEEMRELDEELAEDPLLFPDEETLARTHIFDTEAADNQEYREQFQALLGA